MKEPNINQPKSKSALFEQLSAFEPIIIQDFDAPLYSPNNEDLKFNPYIINGEAALSLSDKDLLHLSKELLSKVESTCLELGIQLGIHLFPLYKHPYNILIHERDHIKKIVQLRPELIKEAQFRVFFHQFKSIQSVGVAAYSLPVPEPKYNFTVFEIAQVKLAPKRPSDSDYLSVLADIEATKLKAEEIDEIIKIVSGKPVSEIRQHFLRGAAEGFNSNISEEELMRMKIKGYYDEMVEVLKETSL